MCKSSRSGHATVLVIVSLYLPGRELTAGLAQSMSTVVTSHTYTLIPLVSEDNISLASQRKKNP